MGKFKAQNFKRILGTSMATIALFNSTNASIVSSLQKRDVRNYYKMKTSNNKETSSRDKILGIIAGIFGVTSLLYAINCQQKLQTLNDKYTEQQGKSRSDIELLRNRLNSYKQELSNAESELELTKEKLEEANKNYEEDNAIYASALKLESDFMCDSIENFFKLHRAFDGYGDLTPVMDTLMQICTLPCDTPEYAKTIDDLFSSIVKDESKKECLKNLFLITNTYRFWKTNIGSTTLGARVCSLFDGSIPGLKRTSSLAVGTDPYKVTGATCCLPVAAGIYNDKPCAIKVTDNVNMNAIRILKEHPGLKHVCNIYDFTFDKGNTVVIMEKMQKILDDDALKNLISNVESIEKYYETVKSWSIQLFKGICELHELGLFHRDIRFCNIMFADEDMKTLKLIDLDNAKLIDKDESTKKCQEYYDVHLAAWKVLRLLRLDEAEPNYILDNYSTEWRAFFSRCLPETPPKDPAGSKEALELLEKAWESGNPPIKNCVRYVINNKIPVAEVVEKEHSDIIEFAHSISDITQKCYNSFAEKKRLSTGEDGFLVDDCVKKLVDDIASGLQYNLDGALFDDVIEAPDLPNSLKATVPNFSNNYTYARLYGHTRDTQNYDLAACVLEMYLNSRHSGAKHITDSSDPGFGAYEQTLDDINKALKLDDGSLENETLPKIREQQLRKKQAKSKK